MEGASRLAFLAAAAAAVRHATVEARTAGSRLNVDPPDPEAYDDVLAEMDGNGSRTNPYVVTGLRELQAAAGDLEAHYRLGTGIDAGATSDWDDGAGFRPIGRRPVPLPGVTVDAFRGTFDGRGNGITELRIARQGRGAGTGLFVGVGAEGTIRGLSLDGEVAGRAVMKSKRFVLSACSSWRIGLFNEEITIRIGAEGESRPPCRGPFKRAQTGGPRPYSGRRARRGGSPLRGLGFPSLPVRPRRRGTVAFDTPG